MLLVFVARYGPAFATGPRLGTQEMSVTAWNVEAGDNGGGRLIEGLRGVNTDLVALEELQPSMAAATTSDPGLAAAYPYRALYPDSSVLGVGLLSRYPIVEAARMPLSCIAGRATCTSPPAMRSVVQPPGGEPTVVFVVHPLPGVFQTILHVPTGIDTQQRDEGLAQIRAAVDDDLAAGGRVIVLGDINTTDRERGYAVIAAGLNDARVQVGSWPGLTWRPDALTGLPVGLLRIDYVFSSMTPLSYGVRCTQLSDHCIISATLGAVSS